MADHSNPTLSHELAGGDVEPRSSNKEQEETGLSSGDEHFDGGDSSGHSGEEEGGSGEEEGDSEDDLDDDYYDEYESSIHSYGEDNGPRRKVGGAEDGLNELEAFRVDWLKCLELQKYFDGQDARERRDAARKGKGNQEVDDGSDTLSVSRLWLGDEGLQAFSQNLDEFEQEQLLQEEMWRYYAENPHRNEDGGTVSTIPTPIANLAQIAPILYRVFDDESVSQSTPDGFLAGSSVMPSDPSEFGRMIGNHAQWRSRVQTPFISVTDSERVVRWHLSIRNRSGIMVAIINTEVLVDLLNIQVWQMHAVMDHFGVKPPGRSYRSTFDNEYLCGLRIPEAAVLAVCEPKLFDRMAEIYSGGIPRV